MAKGARYGCEQCKRAYRMGAETVVRIYLAQPWFNHLETVCPGCKTRWCVYELQEDSIRYMEHNNMVEGDEVQWEVADTASDEVWREFCAFTDREYPRERPISERERKHIDATVAFEAWLLERGESWET